MHTSRHQTLDLRRRSFLVAAAAAALIAGPYPFAFASAQSAVQRRSSGGAIQLAQAESEDDSAPPSDQVEKYIAVYSAMQHDHNLTVDQAASKEGLTVAQFRSLEDRIERNPVVHDRVLQALKAASKKPAPKHQ